MYHLLIVDDVPKIVNGLYEQFLEWGDIELEIYRAYSAVEAMSIIRTVKMDIVLTDIHMPGMSGLELQEQLLEIWPRCKIIFLTGYGDFDYIQSAMRRGGVDYILKVEGDEPIFEAVGKAIAQLRDEWEAEQVISRARQQAREALPLQQKELFTELLEGELELSDISQDRLQALDIPLTLSQNVLLVAGRIDSWKEQTVSSYDKYVFAYGVQNIAAEYLVPLSVISFSLRRSELVWLIQPAAAEGKTEEERWRLCEMVVRDTLPDIQSTCAELLGLQLSFSLSSGASSWDELGSQYLKLQRLLSQGLGRGREVLLFEPRRPAAVHTDPNMPPKSNMQEKGAMLAKKIRQLEWHLDSGQKPEFTAMFDEVLLEWSRLSAQEGCRPLLAEIRLTLSSMFLSHLNRWDLFAEVADRGLAEPLLNGTELRTWEEMEEYFIRLAELLFSLKTHEQKDRIRQIVHAVNQYVEQHLTEPLSLDLLAEHVYLHPTYLSRLYKQATGMRLSYWIKDQRLQRAKELLANPRYKVHEVAAAVGFESSHYFARVFKKETQLTPQEYRNRIMELQNS
ncbi:helix-turn-helix domain-containing protein [Paenibacillus senegalensis]|uniref:helix-turn-helix domain-containing protein n=1 Tax=Paenibacillus senegalensis TaxID=1465766 RepID=UPI0002885FE1|nr:helix-turn-helix domain-containing protein [Paenibacillus senegalensis]